MDRCRSQANARSCDEPLHNTMLKTYYTVNYPPQNPKLIAIPIRQPGPVSHAPPHHRSLYYHPSKAAEPARGETHVPVHRATARLGPLGHGRRASCGAYPQLRARGCWCIGAQSKGVEKTLLEVTIKRRYGTITLYSVDMRNCIPDQNPMVELWLHQSLAEDAELCR